MSLLDNEYTQCSWCGEHVHFEEASYCICHDDMAFCSEDCAMAHMEQEQDKERELHGNN